MANHDFGSPCDCSECGTQGRTEICPRCGFGNAVKLVGSASIAYDRKGMRGTRVTYPDGPARDLPCWKCGAVIEEVAFFTAVDEDECKDRLAKERLEATATPCSRCKKAVTYGRGGYQLIELKEFGDARYCGLCLIQAVKEATPAPDTATERYFFNGTVLKWELESVRAACVDCGKPRWVKARNRWQKRCSGCFKLASQR